MDYAYGINQNISASRYFGWQITCDGFGVNKQCQVPLQGQLLDVGSIVLVGQEFTGPSLFALGNNLYYSGNQYVSGAGWSVSLDATDDSGVCSESASIDGHAVAAAPQLTPNEGSWLQCGSSTTRQLDGTVDTTTLSDGAHVVSFSATNAAGVTTPSNLQTFYVDNQAVGLALSGPTDALSTAGAQYIQASASAGPSGVSSIWCSLDGGPWQIFGGPSATVAVQGIGPHQVSCIAHNNAIDAHGAYGSSPLESWSTSIRQPTVSTVSFAHIADALRCARRRERIRIAPHWIYEHVHGHQVRVHVPAQRRTIRVVRCHPHVVTRRVFEGGRWVLQRVVLLPRDVQRTTKRIRHGARTSVSGWLGTSQGTALGGQQIRILTAADNGSNRYRLAATATTGANGSWSVELPPGPSRLVRAVYSGSATVEPAISGAARVIVPAAVRIKIRPRTTHWGGRIAITGRVLGGHVPAAGELIVLWIGWRGGATEIGHLYARRRGRFAATYTFSRGNGTVAYRLWVATAKESDYPFAPARSRSTSVIVHP